MSRSHHGIRFGRAAVSLARVEPRTSRFIRGVGSGSYSAVEDQLSRDLIAGGHHDEVLLLHELKVRLEAEAIESDSSWQPERDKIAAATGVQGELL